MSFWQGVVAVVALLVAFRLALPLVNALIGLFREQRLYNTLQPGSDLDRRIARRAEGYIRKRPGVRLVVGVWQRGRTWSAGYGDGTPAAPETAAPDTIFEIGSLTKVFTGILLARAEARGLLALDDPITAFLPDQARINDALKGITFRQLATHTSGLPRLPDNFQKAVTDPENPYRHYSAEHLYQYLERARLNRAAGMGGDYSNLGTGLLGHLLTLAWQQPFETLVRQEICEPLGLSDTVITLSEEQNQRFIGGYAPGGQRTAHWDLDVLAPAGALRSTAADLLRFIAANLSENAPPERDAALHRAREVHYRGSAGSKGGLGWLFHRDPISGREFIWHNGGTGGFVSFIGLFPEQETGVVLLSNYGDAFAGDSSVDELGMYILRISEKVSLPVPAPSASSSPAA